MLLTPTPVHIASRDAPDIVLARIRKTAAEWRESTLNPAAREAGLLGWRLFESEAGIELAPRGGGNYTPEFKGRVEASHSGAMISGEIRVEAFGMRQVLVVALAVPWIVVALVLVAPVSGLPWSWVRLPIASGLALGAWVWYRGLRWAVGRQWHVMAFAISEVLQAAAEGPSGGA